MWTTVLTVAFQIVAWILNSKAEDKEMQELFYQFIEKQHNGYLNSANMRIKAKERMTSIMAKPFTET